MNSKLILVPLSAAIGSFCFSLTLFYQNMIVQKAQQWTVLNEFIFLMIGLALSFICLYVLYAYALSLGDKMYDPLQYFYSIFIPVYIMILPVIILGRLSLHKFFVPKANLNELDKNLIIRGDGKMDYLNLPKQALLYMKASDNYVEVHFLQNGKSQIHVLRAKLSAIEKDIPKLLRTHRSYLINPLHFRLVTSSRNGIQAVMGNGDVVPVSKTYKKNCLEQLTFTTNA